LIGKIFEIKMNHDEDMDWQETDSSLINRNPEHIAEDDENNTSKDASSIEEKPKLRGRARPYDLIKEFENFEAANKYMESLDYTKRYTRDSVTGDKIWYTCANRNKCPKTIYLLLNSDSFKCTVYQSTLEHDHQDNDHKARLPKDAIVYIKEQLKLGARKNEELYRGLLNNGFTQLSKQQIAGLKQRLKAENGDKAKKWI